MMSIIYKNRFVYYQLIKDFLEGKIKAWPFRKRFMHQRNIDIDEDIKQGYYNYEEKLSETEKAFEEKYFWKLYNYTPYDDVSAILREYVLGAQKYDIKGPLFFDGIFSDLSVNIRDFYPRDAEPSGYDEEGGLAEFDPADGDIDEAELRRRVGEKFKILEDNKDRWE